MSDDKKPPLMTRFFHACLLLLAGLVALWLAIQLAGQIWGWLLLLAILALLIGAAIWFVRWYRDRRW